MGQKHDDATRAAISASLRLNAALRTPEQREAMRQKQSDAVVCQLWIPHGSRRGHGNARGGGRPKMDPATRIGNTTLAKLEKASIKKIIQELAATQPELFRDT